MKHPLYYVDSYMPRHSFTHTLALCGYTLIAVATHRCDETIELDLSQPMLYVIRCEANGVTFYWTAEQKSEFEREQAVLEACMSRSSTE